MVLRLVKCLGASNGATIDIGLARSIKRDDGIQVGFPLGILHYIGRRLVMKQPGNGLWSGRAARRTGLRELDLSLELRDLGGARPAMRGATAAENRRADEDGHTSMPSCSTRQTSLTESSAC